MYHTLEVYRIAIGWFVRFCRHGGGVAVILINASRFQGRTKKRGGDVELMGVQKVGHRPGSTLAPAVSREGEIDRRVAGSAIILFC